MSSVAPGKSEPATRPGPPPEAVRVVVVASLLLGVIVWSYWPTLAEMAERWRTDPQYSHGFLVPLFSAYLLWSRRGLLTGPQRGSWAGLAIVLGGLALRALGAVAFVGWF